MTRCGALLLVLCSWVGTACGDRSPEAVVPPASEEAQSLPGTYVLDVSHWQSLASASAAACRFADRMNQATGADPNFDVDPPEGAGRPRPARPKPLAEMATAERRIFEEQALAYIVSEAQELRETLTLSADGSFVLRHESRAAEGGSVNLGLWRGVTARGTWSRTDDVLTLTTRESERRNGTKWQVKASMRGTIQADGSILMERAPRQWRDQESQYLPE